MPGKHLFSEGFLLLHGVLFSAPALKTGAETSLFPSSEEALTIACSQAAYRDGHFTAAVVLELWAAQTLTVNDGISLMERA